MTPMSPLLASAHSGWRRRWARTWVRASVRTRAHRVLIGAALLLAGTVAGLAAGQAMAQRAAHRAGACSALNMAAALGYLDAEQRRQVRHALSTALNLDVDLFLGGRPSLREACAAGADG
jgi:uncharacterized membrane protein